MKQEIIHGVKCTVTYAICDPRGAEYGVLEEFETRKDAAKALKERGFGVIQCGIYPESDRTSAIDPAFFAGTKQKAIEVLQNLY